MRSGTGQGLARGMQREGRRFENLNVQSVAKVFECFWTEGQWGLNLIFLKLKGTSNGDAYK